jgi:hypothetical protein
MANDKRSDSHEFCDKRAMGRGAVYGLIGGLLCWAVGWTITILLLHSYVLR